MSGNRVKWLSPDDAPHDFPDVETALREPDGLLAGGGDLASERLLYAYRHGIFPWYDDGAPILWWSPDPRCVLFPDRFHVSRRFRQYVMTSTLTLTFNRSFADVIRACAGDRKSAQGTWILADMIRAYEQLHAEGWAHSVEVREDGALVGGIYGLSIGKVFFGESMFSRRDNASKFAMLALTQILRRHDFALLDCQVQSPHLMSLGATMIPRREFTAILRSRSATVTRFDGWPANALPIRELLADSAPASLQ